MPLAVILLLIICSALRAEWSPEKAAQYLDQRQKDWFAWAPAKAPGGPCVSCHTGATYLLARPVLRAAAHQAEPTDYEKGLWTALSSRVDKHAGKEVFPGFAAEPKATQALGVESIHAALLLSARDRGASWGSDTKQAFARLWSTQTSAGDDRGAWPWFSLKLDPWEMPDSVYYGATQAAMAVGNAPASYRAVTDVKPHVQMLMDYLQRQASKQPLHNRLMLLIVAKQWPDAVPVPLRKQIVRDLAKSQQADGGWSIASLGRWDEHPAAAPSSGSDAYATALASYALTVAVPGKSATKKSQAWLRDHQQADGSWKSASMNKRFPQGSMMEGFMTDAATAYAVLALGSTR